MKSAQRLVAAYDDAAGVTAAFNKNVLAVVNRDLGADFDLDAFDHVAVWDAAREWIEMRLRSRQDQIVRIAALDLDVHFERGEEMRTEISAKFRRGDRRGRAGRRRAAAHAVVDRSGGRLRALAVGAGLEQGALVPGTGRRHECGVGARITG